MERSIPREPLGRRPLVDLKAYPGLASYLQRHASRIRGRYVARNRPASWYRTIDRVDPELQARPKLLLPDLKAAAHPVLDKGEFYPHHNLYYVVSDKWDLEVLEDSCCQMWPTCSSAPTA